MIKQGWEFIKENKKVRKKERTQALDQEKKSSELKNINKFYFQPLL